MNNACSSQPDRDEDGYELSKADRGRSLQNVQVLQDVRDSHQAEGSQEPKT